jgi:hypothetical protein
MGIVSFQRWHYKLIRVFAEQKGNNATIYRNALCTLTYETIAHRVSRIQGAMIRIEQGCYVIVILFHAPTGGKKWGRTSC